MIELKEFQARRRRLLEQLPENSVAIVRGATMKIRNRDAEYPFRQESSFLYLTGFDEADALLVLRPGALGGEQILFCLPRNAEQEIWTGYRLGPERAPEALGVDLAYSNEQIATKLPELLSGASKVYFSIGQDEAFDHQVCAWFKQSAAAVRSGIAPPEAMVQLDHLIDEMRLFKSEAEIALMQRAGDVSAQAHCRAMEVCRPGLYEYQLEAEILHEFARSGCRSPAYQSIVGGGERACILHYIENSQPLSEGDLVLIDAGCECEGYAGDITRTFPVSGRFSAEQKAIYQLVLDAQLACIDLVKPGTLWNEVHDLSVKVITAGLVELGILKGDVENLIETGAYRAFYMHRIGHWLGLDVHDVGSYRAGDDWRPLEPGMVMTVEPGVYISPSAAVDPRWRGIGVRIEDDVLVTETGNRILTSKVPKQIDEIETLMRRA